MIPKIIHYCWFGRNPLPDSALKCISSWKKYLPDYEIKEWNEDNFDIEMIPYTKEAYQTKKYAFVSDFARFWILYKYGGLYFDTDVEVIKNMDSIVERGAFMGCETRATNEIRVAPGLALGAEPGMALYKELIDEYSKDHFVNEDSSNNVKTIVARTTEMLFKYGLTNEDKLQMVLDTYIYPDKYFCPMNRFTKKIKISEETVSIHHYDASWQTPETQWIQSNTYNYSWIPAGGFIVKFIGIIKFRGVSAALLELRTWLNRKF